MSTVRKQSYVRKLSKNVKSLKKNVKKSFAGLKSRLSTKTRSRSTTGGKSNHKVSRKKSSSFKTRASGETAKFWCMRCKNFSKSEIDKYEKGKNGNYFAKGHCSKCDTKLSLIVKNPTQ